MAELTTCKNCGNKFSGRFCNQCGEKVYSDHFTLAAEINTF